MLCCSQLCLTLCTSMDCSHPGSSVRGDSPGKNTGVGCYALLQGVFPMQELNLVSLMSPALQVDSLPSKPPEIMQLLLIPSKNLEGIEFIYFHRHKGEEQCEGASQVAQMVKCLPAMQETGVRSLGQEDPLKKEMVTHSSTLAQKIPWIEEPGGLQSTGSQRVGHD